MGTFVELTLSSGSAFDEHANFVFSEIERLENKFSFFSAGSLVSAVNNVPIGQPLPIDDELCDLVSLALRLRDASNGKFTPFVSELLPLQLDLSGIAKGFIVDCAIEALLLREPDAEGCINAGGDLRFFGGPTQRSVSLRVGSAESGLVRELIVETDAVATSSPDFSRKFSAGSDAQSQTRFTRKPFQSVASVTVLANSCAIADALTKVALFSSPEEIENCLSFFKEENIQILRFDSRGELVA